MRPLFSHLNDNTGKRLNWVTWIILISATAVSIFPYLLDSAFTYRTGFPLDDSWIHQTYARNLALRGEWSFLPGQLSGGSTAPLWSALLAIGFKLGLSPFIWTFFLGGLCLFFLALSTEAGMRKIFKEYQGIIPWVGLLIIFEWHLVWASVSGMETILLALIAFILVFSLIRKPTSWLLLGVLAGISVWVRPDGVTLIGPIIFVALFSQPTWKLRTRLVCYVLFGFAIFFLPYLLFNLTLAGTPFPTTFYAKQAEYSSWQARPILERMGEVAIQFLSGPAIILFPGVIITTGWAIRNKAWGMVSAILWMTGYVGIYILRLPAYQHGRYLMPVMPAYLFIGYFGYLQFLWSKKTLNRNGWLIKTTWRFVLGLVCIGFWFLGMRSYSNDVRFIESEMVNTANWVTTNLPPDAVIAAHDIGALGYFGNHQLVDLAGLISPEVIPFLRDEQVLADYLNLRGVDYLIDTPGFYSHLTSGLQPVFTAGSPSVVQGEAAQNMTVYKWSKP
jgi:hypothetical protein